MRHYPRNSPQAAGRILALALLSDGHLSRLELEALDTHHAHTRLGLARTELHAVVHGFCEDLLAAMHLSWDDACKVDAHTLAALLADIDRPDLQRELLSLCSAIVQADAHVADGESRLLTTALTHWGLQPALQHSTPAPSTA